jgi:hypothetical protein
LSSCGPPRLHTSTPHDEDARVGHLSCCHDLHPGRQQRPSKHGGRRRSRSTRCTPREEGFLGPVLRSRVPADGRDVGGPSSATTARRARTPSPGRSVSAMSGAAWEPRAPERRASQLAPRPCSIGLPPRPPPPGRLPHSRQSFFRPQRGNTSASRAQPVVAQSCVAGRPAAERPARDVERVAEENGCAASGTSERPPRRRPQETAPRRHLLRAEKDERRGAVLPCMASSDGRFGTPPSRRARVSRAAATTTRVSSSAVRRSSRCSCSPSGDLRSLRTNGSPFVRVIAYACPEAGYGSCPERHPPHGRAHATRRPWSHAMPRRPTPRRARRGIRGAAAHDTAPCATGPGSVATPLEHRAQLPRLIGTHAARGNATHRPYSALYRRVNPPFGGSPSAT